MSREREPAVDITLLAYSSHAERRIIRHSCKMALYWICQLREVSCKPQINHWNFHRLKALIVIEWDDE